MSPTIIFTLDSPQIVVYRDFASNEECDELIEAARPTLAPVNYPLYVGGIKREYVGTAMERSVPIVDTIERRLAEHLGYQHDNHPSKQFRVFRYGVGDQFPPHMDRHFVPEPESGGRMTTMLLYLNTCEEGGSTSFPRLGLSVRAVRGHCLVFTTTGSNRKEDPRCLHTGSIIVKGEKWVASKWFVR